MSFQAGRGTSSGQPTKFCPYCGQEILEIATRCKYCFADLEKERRGGYLGFIILVILILFGGLGLLFYIKFQTPTGMVVTRDPMSETLTIKKTYPWKTSIVHIPYADIEKIEFVTESSFASGNFWCVYVTTEDKKRYKVNYSYDDEMKMKSYAEEMSLQLKKPLVEISKVKAGKGLYGKQKTEVIERKPWEEEEIVPYP